MSKSSDLSEFLSVGWVGWTTRVHGSITVLRCSNSPWFPLGTLSPGFSSVEEMTGKCFKPKFYASLWPLVNINCALTLGVKNFRTLWNTKVIGTLEMYIREDLIT